MSDREIFTNAPVGASPKVMTAYLSRICGCDGDLRARVEALIAAEKESGGETVGALHPMISAGNWNWI